MGQDGLKGVAGEAAIHERVNRLPFPAVQVAADNLVQAELFDLMRAQPHLPEAGHIAFRRVERTGFAEFGEKPEQVHALLARQVVDQSGRHQRAAHRAIFDVVLRQRDFLVRHVADDDLLVVFAHQDAGQLLAVLGFEHDCVVAFLDLAVRIEQRL